MPPRDARPIARRDIDPLPTPADLLCRRHGVNRVELVEGQHGRWVCPRCLIDYGPRLKSPWPAPEEEDKAALFIWAAAGLAILVVLGVSAHLAGWF